MESDPEFPGLAQIRNRGNSDEDSVENSIYDGVKFYTRFRDILSDLVRRGKEYVDVNGSVKIDVNSMTSSSSGKTASGQGHYPILVALGVDALPSNFVVPNVWPGSERDSELVSSTEEFYNPGEGHPLMQRIRMPQSLRKRQRAVEYESARIRRSGPSHVDGADMDVEGEGENQAGPVSPVRRRSGGGLFGND